MSQENLELARTGYAAMNRAYATGDWQTFTRHLEATCHPEVVLKPSGILPESAEMHGREGILQFAIAQTEAFEEMWIEPQEFIDAGDRVAVPVRLGGRARHTGLDIEFSVVHVWTIRDGKSERLDMFRTKAEALEAVGLSD
jgi:ketosteroid isomerase-like protein